jgi:hypothetical protein
MEMPSEAWQLLAPLVEALTTADAAGAPAVVGRRVASTVPPCVAALAGSLTACAVVNTGALALLRMGNPQGADRTRALVQGVFRAIESDAGLATHPELGVAASLLARLAEAAGSQGEAREWVERAVLCSSREGGSRYSRLRRIMV